jgi:hypothetical protein
LPGWGESQPLVIGRRVVVLNEPDLVVCYDANTGKELWRDRVELMTLPLLGADHRTLEPAPADAAKRQVVWELARASAYLHRNVRGATGQRAKLWRGGGVKTQPLLIRQDCDGQISARLDPLGDERAD